MIFNRKIRNGLHIFESEESDKFSLVHINERYRFRIKNPKGGKRQSFHNVVSGRKMC